MCFRAQQLADWLTGGAAEIPARVEQIPGGEVFGEVAGKQGIAGRTGIVFFQHYWVPGDQGNHIDLWNGARLTDLSSWLRIYARVGSLGLGSDYRKAKAVQFFPVA